MLINRIQFQPGLSMPEFFGRYGSEPQCEAALESARWPEGFRCPRCGTSTHCGLRGANRKMFQCNACRHQTSLIAGTIFQDTKLGLTVWFLAIYLISQAKTGLSALALKRQLGVSYRTAWLIHNKLMHSMAGREERYVLKGQIQVDDAYLGGERSGGKAGRGSENKVPFVAAVSLSDEGHPLRVKLSPRCPVSPSRRLRRGPGRTWPWGAPYVPMGWPVSAGSSRPAVCISPPSSRDESRKTCPSSSGSTPSSVTSRPA